ncbi:Uncharacterized protein Fot_17818 [Forsythia ovata]|uniref:Uncharacterized protein n=1 Tax=Forsythia ovata TaxID=205694 RepID=A0ABD1VGF0_9LAMI
MKTSVSGIDENHCFHAFSISQRALTRRVIVKLNPDIVEKACSRHLPPRNRKWALRSCSLVNLLTWWAVLGKVPCEFIPVLSGPTFNIKVDSVQNGFTKGE